MEILLDLFILLTTMSIFLMNMDFRYSKMKTIILFVSFGVISFSAYILLLQQGFEREVLSSICFSIPSFFLCLWTSKYRGTRFIFTFAIIDLLGMTAVIIGRCISIIFDYNQMIIFVSTTILLVLYLVGAVTFRNKYLEILRNVTKGWGYMSLAVIMIYVFTFVLIGYPTPLYNRREYVPTILVYIVVVTVILKVIYDSARNNIKVYNEKMEKDNLRMKLELNQVYYDMAYKDELTGVKNRNAFEEYMDKIKHNCDKKIVCVSLDINNLKIVNDEIGHHAGDEVIRKAGYLLGKVFESEENIFRVGGDEFIVIAEYYDDAWMNDKFEKMNVWSEKIRGELEMPFEYARGKSIGKASDIKELLRKADEDMYNDKRLTRGQGFRHIKIT